MQIRQWKMRLDQHEPLPQKLKPTIRFTTMRNDDDENSQLCVPNFVDNAVAANANAIQVRMAS